MQKEERILDTILDLKDLNDCSKVLQIKDNLDFKFRFLLADYDPTQLTIQRSRDTMVPLDLTDSVFEYTTVGLSKGEVSERNLNFLKFISRYAPSKLAYTILLGVTSCLGHHILG